MAKGIKTRDLKEGAGLSVVRAVQVVVHVRGFLSRGDVVIDTRKEGQPWRIELGKRECLSGLRRGVEGMRVGGVREMVISPHLGYGATGIPGRIPPNAVLRLEVELLE